MRDENQIDANDLLPALPYRARETRRLPGLVLCLLDPDHYLADPGYVARRKAGAPALRNLWAFDDSGRKLWEAELPEAGDYYYEIVSLDPLTVRSYSGYTCELGVTDGSIADKTFCK
jgi:hypothetical protein